MTNEEAEIEKLNEGRMLREASRALLPMILRMREDAVAQTVAAFKGRKLDELPALAAELSVLSDIAGKITRNNKETEQRERKLYGSGQ